MTAARGTRQDIFAHGAQQERIKCWYLRTMRKGRHLPHDMETETERPRKTSSPLAQDVQNPTGTEGKCWTKCIQVPGFKRSFLNVLSELECHWCSSAFFWMSVIQLLFKGTNTVCAGVIPVHSIQNLTPLFDEYRTDTDKKIQKCALLRASLLLNQSNQSCTEPGSLADTFENTSRQQGKNNPSTQQRLTPRTMSK